MPGKEWIDFGASLGGDLLGGMFGAIDGALSRQWQEKMWHMQNEYNSPKAQIARLKEAGLNPAMMYANGSAGGASASVPSAPAPIMKNMKLDFARALQAKRDAQIQDKQLDGLAQDLIVKEEAAKQAKEITKQHETKTKMDDLAYRKAQHEADNGFWDFPAQMNQVQREYIKAQTRKIEEEITTLIDTRGYLKNEEERKQVIHKWNVSMMKLEQEGVELDNSWKRVRNQLQNLSLEEQQALKDLNFDPNNPPASYRDYQHWVDMASKLASTGKIKAETGEIATSALDKIFSTIPPPAGTMLSLGSRLLHSFFAE